MIARWPDAVTCIIGAPERDATGQATATPEIQSGLHRQDIDTAVKGQLKGKAAIVGVHRTHCQCTCMMRLAATVRICDLTSLKAL